MPKPGTFTLRLNARERGWLAEEMRLLVERGEADERQGPLSAAGRARLAWARGLRRTLVPDGSDDADEPRA